MPMPASASTEMSDVAMITVSPTEFTQVEYDADQIAALAAEALAGVAGRVDSEATGLAADSPLDLRIDEDEATSKMRVESLDPIVFGLDGGAIEDYRDPRRLGGLETKIAVTRLLLEVLDRRNPDFGAPELGAESDPAYRQAWDVNVYGRVAQTRPSAPQTQISVQFSKSARIHRSRRSCLRTALVWATISPGPPSPTSPTSPATRSCNAGARHLSLQPNAPGAAQGQAVSCIETPSSRSISGGSARRPSHD